MVSVIYRAVEGSVVKRSAAAAGMAARLVQNNPLARVGETDSRREASHTGADDVDTSHENKL